jgi:hypothetical protein
MILLSSCLYDIIIVLSKRSLLANAFYSKLIAENCNSSFKTPHWRMVRKCYNNLCTIIFIYYLLRSGHGGTPGAEMDGGTFHRAGLLPDITFRDTSAEGAPERRHLIRESRTGSLSSVKTTSSQVYVDGLLHAPSEEEGLSLLVHGSPIGDTSDGTSDEHLLDYESDSDSSTNPPGNPQCGQDVAQIQQTICSAVATEEDRDQSLAGPSGLSNIGSGVNSPLDAVYFQCRSARTAGFKDVLISVSQDDSFGKKLTVQSPCIGSFEDYSSITETFTQATAATCTRRNIKKQQWLGSSSSEQA